MEEVGIPTPARDLSSCRKSRREGGREEIGAVEGVRALVTPTPTPPQVISAQGGSEGGADSSSPFVDRLFPEGGAGMNCGQ